MKGNFKSSNGVITSWSKEDQIFDGIFKATQKDLFLDVNKLDGQSKLLGPPSYQVGIGSVELSNGSGEFKPQWDYDFNLGDFAVCQDLTLHGNDKLNIFPSKYIVEFYNEGLLQDAVSITQSTVSQTTTLAKAVVFNKITLKVAKINIPNAGLKLIGFEFYTPPMQFNSVDQLKVHFEEAQIIKNRFQKEDKLQVHFEEAQIIKNRFQKEDKLQVHLKEISSIGNALSTSDIINFKVTETEELDIIWELSDNVNLVLDELREWEMVTNEDIKIVVDEVSHLDNIHAALASETRVVYARVQVNYTHEKVDPFMKVSSNIDVANVSDINNLINGTRLAEFKYLFLNGNNLTGEYKLIDPKRKDTPVGFASMSDDTNMLIQEVPIVLLFAKRNISKLFLTGDETSNTYPTNFTVAAYNEGVEVDQFSVTDNTTPNWSKTVDYKDVTTLIYTIFEINRPNESLRLMDMIGATVETYESDEIISINILEETMPETLDVALGSVTANQLNLSLLNENGKFSSNNKKSSIHDLLKSNREITVWFGIEVDKIIEWVQMGKYWSSPWRASLTDLVVNTIANDRLAMLTNIVTLPTIVNTSMYDFLVQLFLNAEVATTDYVIDTYFKTLMIPFAYTKRLSHNQVLAELANASLCYIYCDRLGRILIYRRLQVVRAPYMLYSDSDVFAYDVEIDDRQIVNDIKIWVTPHEKIKDVEVINDNEIFELKPNETLTVDYLFATSIDVNPNFQPTFRTTDSAISVSNKLTSWGVIYTFKNTDKFNNASIGKLTATANIISILPVENPYREQDTNSIIEYGTRSLEHVHYYIQEPNTAQAIGKDIITFYNSTKPLLKLDTRGDFAIDLSHDVLAYSYDDIDELSRYKQVRASHSWDGTYQSNVTLDFERRIINNADMD